ncbi:MULTISPECIES: DUF4178 domain-containing protein [Vitreoscilla]|uniref:DUF4178 domain-containing protein n=1 Tax=Vitreoscilla stercoraria TaxID=61 RepID=A0ABY4E9W7_VITST|nr:MULTISPECIES: DUF4178 domain-containing protein [Vitreoscilla]AUZ03884.2 hypothetical protein ADP71_00240 [Vitreoscilla sp. C1]UOO92189.1 DUF4178 domain-containing protein [Vitreoscilla stercoraria]
MASLFHTSCPQCGANVEVQSATAVTVVCGSCHSMLVRSGEQLAASGRHSVLLQDFSPLQVGTNGSYKGMLFTLVGRLQVQYEGGSWNEWHALLHDGRSTWLSESADLFVFTELETAAQIGELPKFEDIQIGATWFSYGPKSYAVADIREANRSRYAAEGELPYIVPENEVAKVVDCRSTDTFMTLDYTNDNKRPEVFIGQGVELSVLGLQNLRTKDQIQESAGRLKGSAQGSKCPNCGGTVQWVTGVATHVVCHYCQSQIDFSAEQAVVVETRNMRMEQDNAFTLNLGSQATIMRQQWWVIGAMKQSEVAGNAARSTLYPGNQPKILVPEGDPWCEYLLYAPEKGFLWLTEMSGNRWAIAKTLNTWPQLQMPLRPINDNKRPVNLLYDYGGQVQYAAGAFYWNVAPKDVTYYTDFGTEKKKLSAALTAFEQSWSAVTEIPAAAVAAWFQNNQIAKPMELGQANQLAQNALRVEASHFNAGAGAAAVNTASNAVGSNKAMIWLLIYLVLNFPAMLMGLMGDGLFGVIIVTLIVHWILKMIFNKNT